MTKRLTKERRYGLIPQYRQTFCKSSGSSSKTDVHRFGGKTRDEILSQLTQEQQEFMRKFVLVDAKTRKLMSTYEQGDPKWKRSRMYRVTGSIMSNAVGNSNFKTTQGLVKEMLIPEFTGNAASRRGNELEPVACDLFCQETWTEIKEELLRVRNAYDQHQFDSIGTNQQRQKNWKLHYGEREYDVPLHYLQMPEKEFVYLLSLPYTEKVVEDVFVVRHQGLVPHLEFPWIAASSDGDIFLFGQQIGILEIKCPQDNVHYPLIPYYYFDQLQGNMLIQDVEFCKFCVFSTEHGLRTTHIEKDPEYCQGFLIPALHVFYFNDFLPEAMKHQRNIESFLSSCSSNNNNNNKKNENNTKSHKRQKLVA